MTDATTTAATSTTTSTDRDLPPAGRAYLEAVSTHLADLDVADRGELVSDIADALAEQPKDATFETIVVALGSPSTFAAELRSAAGLPPAPVMVAGASEGRTFAASALDRADAAFTWTGRELAPLWWIVRGLLVAAALFIFIYALGLGGGSNSSETMAAFGLIAVAISIALGVRTRAKGDEPAASSRQLRLRGAATIVAGTIFAIALGNMVSDSGTEVYYGGEVADSAVQGLVLDGEHVANVYAFDEQGNPLDNVRLYTDAGAPLEIFAHDGDPMREAFADRTGESIFNVFPIRYRDGENGEVVDRSAGFPDSPGALRGASVAPMDSVTPAEAARPVEPTATAPKPSAAAEPAATARPAAKSAAAATASGD